MSSIKILNKSARFLQYLLQGQSLGVGPRFLLKKNSPECVRKKIESRLGEVLF
jgi:hypothetical protein